MRMPSPGDPHSLPPLVAIVGPTAVGKTALAVRLAEVIAGEIVSADSRQAYRGMDIGTAKPTPEEQKRALHHLLDIANPDQSLGVAEFQRQALAAIDGILARGKTPLLVGGTGQYVLALIEGWEVPRVPPDAALRRALYQQALRDGTEALHARLRAADPLAADRIDPRNVRRVVRALEVCLVTGQPISEQQKKTAPPYRILMAGLTLTRTELYRRVDARVDAMLRAGLEDEVRHLVSLGYGFGLPAMSGVGYGQFESYLLGKAELADVVRDIKRATRRFVRHQYNWFRLDDRRIRWFEAQLDPFAQVLALVYGFLSDTTLLQDHATP